MRITVGMAVLIACVAVVGQARAQFCEVERIRVQSQGDGVSADFSSVDTSTCALGIETIVHVEGSVGVINTADTCGSGGNRVKSVTTTQTNVVAVAVAVYDHCADAQILSVAGTGEADELHVSQNFKTGSLRASFDGLDDSDQPVPVTIDLVWNGVGQKEQTGDHVTDNQKILRIHYASNGTLRDAVATGSVTVGGTDRTPSPSTDGTLERDASRSLTVYR